MATLKAIALVVLLTLAAGCVGPTEQALPTTLGDPDRVAVVLISGEIRSEGPPPEQQSACDWMPRHSYDIATEEIRYAVAMPFDRNRTLVVLLFDGDFEDPYVLGCGSFWDLVPLNHGNTTEIRLTESHFTKAFPFQLERGDLAFPSGVLRPFTTIAFPVDEVQGDHRYHGQVRATHLGHWQWSGIRHVGWEEL